MALKEMEQLNYLLKSRKRRGTVLKRKYPVKAYNPGTDTQQPLPGKSKVLTELCKQKLSGTLCDVVFVYENFQLYSHACVLASFSPYMMKLFLLDHHNSTFPQNNWCFKTPLKINLTDIFHQSSCICCNCFTNVIDFIYTSKIYMYNCHLDHIEYAATMLQISELISVCTKYKETEQRKCKFNRIIKVDDHVTNAVHGNVANTVRVEQKFCQSELSQNESVDIVNVYNQEFHKNIKSKSVANTECQISKKFKTLTSRSAQQNSNKMPYEAEIQKCHLDNSEFTADKNLPNQNVTNNAKLKDTTSTEQNSFKTDLNNVNNRLNKQKFLTAQTLIENKNSQPQIVNHNISKNEDLSLTAYKNDNQIITRKNMHTTDNQFSLTNLSQEMIQKKIIQSCINNSVAEEKSNEAVKRTTETVEAIQSKCANIGKIKDRTQLNIRVTSSSKQQSSDEENTNSYFDEKEKKNRTVHGSTLNTENMSKSLLTDVTKNELRTDTKNNKEQTGELTNNTVVENKRDVADLSSAAHVVESITKSICNETSESCIIANRDKHDSEQNVCESEKENKMNIQIEQTCKETKKKTKFCCEVCQYKTLKLSKIVEHLETNDHGQTSCCICTYTFSDNKEFKHHLKLHKENMPFQCLTCSKKFKSITYFKNHLLSHSSIKSFVCPICKASFKYSYKLSKHKVKEHSETLQKKFICEHCGHTTSEKRKLLLHLQEHGFALPTFKCSAENCTFQTTWEINLVMHEKIHLERDPFFCQMCGKLFMYEKNLKCHIYKKHNPSSVKFQCSKCNFTTDTKHCLQVHITRHCKQEVKCKSKKCTIRKHVYSDKNIKPYKCEICHEQFINRGNVQRHKIEVHNLGVLKMKCNTCSYSTTRTDQYRVHLSKHDSTETKGHRHKRRKLASKTNDHAVHLDKTVIRNKNLSCQPIVNCVEMSKCDSQKLSVSDNEILMNKSENDKVKNNNDSNPHKKCSEKTAFCLDRKLSDACVTDHYNKIYMCETCGERVDNEENLHIHKSEKHIVQHDVGSQMVTEDCCIKNKVVVLPNSDKQNALSNSYFDQQTNDNLMDVTVSLPVSATEIYLNEQTGQFCRQTNCKDKLLPDKGELNFTSEESVQCNMEYPEEQNKVSSVSSIRTLLLNEETGELTIIEPSGSVKYLAQNNLNKSDDHYNVPSNLVQTSVSNLCNSLNHGICNTQRTLSDENDHINIENTQPSMKSGSADVFSVHNVAELNKTIVLNETTGEINIIIDTNSNVNDSENGNVWQSDNSATWILDEATGTLTNVGTCNEQQNELLALNEQRRLISFSNQNTHVILNEGTGELTFINLNSDTLEENDDNFGHGLYFDDDTQSNFTIDSVEDFTCDNISLPSPGDNDEGNSVTEFLNELTGEINLCDYSSINNSGKNIANNSNCIQCTRSEGRNDNEVAWNPSNEDDEDLSFLNELTGDLLKSSSKIDNNDSIVYDSVNVENDSVPALETRNTIIVRNEILNQTTGQLSVHLDDELTKESTDSVYLNKEMGIISWNTLNQETSESNIFDKKADWFYDNFQNDSLDSFTADGNDFSKQFQYNILSRPSEDLTLHPDSNDTLLNESTGELVSTVCTKSQQ